MKRFSFLLVVLFCIVKIANAQLPIGADAPDIKLPDSLGKWKPMSEVKAKIILLDFWAAWCYPCVKSMPELKRIYATYKDKGLEVYAVSLDKDYRNWVATCARLDIPFIQVNDPYGFNGNACHNYNIHDIPNKLLIKDGKVIGSDMSLENLERIIKENL